MATTPYVLVTNCCNYENSHIMIELLRNNYWVVGIDSLEKNSVDVVTRVRVITGNCGGNLTFHRIDMDNDEELEEIFNRYRFSYVVYNKAVMDDSKGIEIYKNSVNQLCNLVDMMSRFRCYKLAFGSSMFVYGRQLSPLKETCITGFNLETSTDRALFTLEQILNDLHETDNANKWAISILRLAIPVGADKTGLIGDNADNYKSNGFGRVLDIMNGKMKQLKIRGRDYRTKDKTREVDVIHVTDLARGYVKSLDKLVYPGMHVYNIGSGQGTSSLSVANKFMEVCNRSFPVVFERNRSKSMGKQFLDISKAKLELGWRPTMTLDDQVRDSVAWNKYATSESS